ncbi:MAG: SulP family inorganic anion transporter, partial [Proteobacteria bacterium]|nr:SulP family inorganic anion transporter [Pseudomonadota bacterium]
MTLKHAPQDISAGFVVFLVALPLCLGIALASDAPLASGLLSGLIAGLFVSWLSGSQLSVSGPSAGLSLTIASAIATLGSFESVLVAIFLAGTMQIAFG